MGVGDLGLTLATVGITKLKRENTTVIEADKNGKNENLYY
jgi:hypothetical protein